MNDQNRERYKLFCNLCKLNSHDGSESEAEVEWCEIISDSNRLERIEDRIEQWLTKYSSHRDAGINLAQLIMIRPAERHVEMAKEWMDANPDHVYVENVLTSLIAKSPSEDVSARALKALSEDPYLITSLYLIETIVKSSEDKLLKDKVEELLESNPSDDTWDNVFRLLKRNMTEYSESMIVKWIELNKSNSEIFLLPFATFTVKSPKVRRAIFDWLLDGGRQNKFQASVLAALIEPSSLSESDLLPAVAERAREWLRENPNHERTHLVLCNLFHFSPDSRDIEWARSCIANDPANSVQLVASLIQFALHDHDVVQTAKMILRKQDPTNRSHLLTGVLIAACADEETISWAKQSFKATDDLRILQGLLVFAPDVESIELAIESMERWHTAPFLEGQLLCDFLRASQGNAKGIENAKKWIDKNADHYLVPSIEKFMQ